MDLGIASSQSGGQSQTASADQSTDRRTTTTSGQRFVAPASNTIGLLAQIAAEVASGSQTSGGTNTFGPSFILPGASRPLPTSDANSTPGVAPGQPFLRDAAGGAVAIRAALDSQGNRVVTATLATGDGSVAGFQASNPADQPSFRAVAPTQLSGPLPQILDAEGNSLPVRAYEDRIGGIVLGVELRGSNGAQQTFYSQIDSLGYPSDTEAGTGPISVADDAGLDVGGQSFKTSGGQAFVETTLYRPSGVPQQFQTQVDNQPALSLTLRPSTTSYANPTGPSGAEIDSNTFELPQGAQVQQVYLSVNGVAQAFYAAVGSDSSTVQPAVVGAQVIPRAAPFSENPNLTQTGGQPSLSGLSNFVSNAYRSTQSLTTPQVAFSAFSTQV